MMKKLTSTVATLLVFVATTTLTVQSFAVEENNIGPGLTYVGAPLALRGVDPVAFIDIGNRIDGQAVFAAEHEGVAYYFTNDANLKTFQRNPDKYVPENGGFCTYGVSVGKKFDGDPRFAAVLNKKLYVFLNEGIYKEFLKDEKGTIKKAKKQWNKIQHVAASEL